VEELDVRGVRAALEVVAPSGDGSDTACPTVVRLAGEVDISNAAEVGSTLQRLVGDSATQIVVDVSELRFIDSSGLAALLRVAASVDRFELRRPTAVVARVVEVAGLHDVLRSEP
jgi:anti-sigma B factor antagonist